MTEPNDEGNTSQVILTEPECKIVPVPEHVSKDDTAEEICRVWIHGDGSLSIVTSPYSLNGPDNWGEVLSAVARSLAENMPDQDIPPQTILGAIVRSFLDSLGIPVQFIIVSKPPPEPLDPDKAN